MPQISSISSHCSLLFAAASIAFTTCLMGYSPAYAGFETVDDLVQPVIIVNRLDRRYPIHVQPFGASSRSDYSIRIDAEKAIQQKQFKEAARLYAEAVKEMPSSIRCKLGYANALMELNRYDEALPQLAAVRNVCHHLRYRHETTAVVTAGSEESALEQFDDDWTAIGDADMLPKEAVEAIDFEARAGLERAVLKVTKIKKIEKGWCPSEYQTDRRCIVLKASLHLAKQYHAKSQPNEVKALIRLASENTRTLPLGLILHLTEDGSIDEQWEKLASRCLNSICAVEKEWYLMRLWTVSESFAPTDLRKAAVSHYTAITKNKNSGKYANFYQASEALSKAGDQVEEIAANNDYDRGVLAYNDKSHDDSNGHFEKALEYFKRKNKTKAVADTEFNLGCLAFSDNKPILAKEHFKNAVTAYSSIQGSDNSIEDKRKASYNAAAIIIDGKPDPEDEKFLRDFHSKFNSNETKTLLGIYLLKLNRNAEAAQLLSTVDKPKRQPSEIDFPVDDIDPLGNFLNLSNSETDIRTYIPIPLKEQIVTTNGTVNLRVPAPFAIFGGLRAGSRVGPGGTIGPNFGPESGVTLVGAFSGILDEPSAPQPPEPKFVHSDKEYSRDQLVEAMFARLPRIEHYVNSRFFPVYSFGFAPVLPKLTRGHEREYGWIAGYLAQQATAKTNHETASLYVQKTEGVSPKSEEDSERAYLRKLNETLTRNLFSPLANRYAHRVVSLVVQSDGVLKIDSLTRQSSTDTEISSTARGEDEDINRIIVDEAITWSSPMPPPPVSLVGKTISVIFDGHMDTSPGSILNILGPREWRDARPEQW